MFWRFGGYSNVSTIDTLLDRQTTTLEDLLEEQDLIQELKSHNPKLLEFLRDDRRLHALLRYIIAPGPDIDEDGEQEPENVSEEQEKAEKKRLKYAFVACEILSCETYSITEAFVSNTEFLKEFWGFLRRPPPLDPLQAGYFTKVNETLLEKKTEDMLEFFKSLPEIVPAILKHVDCPMVMDLLLKIISLEKSEGGAGIVEWLHDQNLVPELLSSLSVECNPSTQTSAGDFLKAIITISANAAQNEQSCIGPNCLTRQLVSESCIQQLIAHMLQGGNPLTVGVGIIIEVIRKNNSDYDPENGLNPDALPTNHDPIFLGTLLRAFAKHVPDFMNLILSSKHTVVDGDKTKSVDRGMLKSAWGTEIEPLGFDRFKTCELMAELLHCSNMGLLNEYGSEEFVRARDVERDRLRVAGRLASQKAIDDSTVDISLASSKMDLSGIGEEQQQQQQQRSTEEDGFEKVSAPDSEKKVVDIDDLMDEPLTPTINAADSPHSPVPGINEHVRRLSLDDLNTQDDIDEPNQKVVDTLTHPEDKPAPLFTRKGQSAPLKSPILAKTHAEHSIMSEDVSVDDSAIHTQNGASQLSQAQDEPVVGDYLKMMFVEHRVVPTILSFFFRFPWNNFLHNVVYDVVQQVFNGSMDRGHNKFLAFDLFDTGKVTEQIIQGQKRSEETEKKQNMRLGYMGHLTLVAEEVVKFGERHAREVLSESVQNYIYGKDWEEYVTTTLAETRDRDNAILGGFRPENGVGPRQAVMNAVSGGAGTGGSDALAQVGLTAGQQGLDSIDLNNNGSATSQTFSTGSSLLSNFGSSSDDEDEDEDDHDENQVQREVQLSAADTGVTSESDQPVPILPPPPAPLNIEPSRARRRLADRLAHRQQQQQEQEAEAAATEFGMEDDPFSTMDDNDNDDGQDPFALDEEEQDITTFGNRNRQAASRGIHNLFVASHSQQGEANYLRHSPEEESSSSSSDSSDEVDTAIEARTSLERRPLDIDDDDDDDDDDEMGEMVEPTEEANSSDDEVIPVARDEKHHQQTLHDEEDGSEFDGQGDKEHDDVVEISLPKTKNTKRHSRGSRGSIG